MKVQKEKANLKLSTYIPARSKLNASPTSVSAHRYVEKSAKSATCCAYLQVRSFPNNALVKIVRQMAHMPLLRICQLGATRKL